MTLSTNIFWKFDICEDYYFKKYSIPNLSFLINFLFKNTTNIINVPYALQVVCKEHVLQNLKGFNLTANF